MSKRRAPGFYWVVLVHLAGNATVAHWNGHVWVIPSILAATPRVRKVISDRLIPPAVER